MNLHGTYYDYEKVGLNTFNPYTIVNTDLENFNNLLEGPLPTILEKGTMKEREQQILNVLPLHEGEKAEFTEGLDLYGNYRML